MDGQGGPRKIPFLKARGYSKKPRHTGPLRPNRAPWINMEWQRVPSLFEALDIAAARSPQGSVPFNDVDKGEGSSSEISFPRGVRDGLTTKSSSNSSQEINPTPQVVDLITTHQAGDLWTPQGMDNVNETRELHSPHLIHMNSTIQTNDAQTSQHIDLSYIVDSWSPQLFEKNPSGYTIGLPIPHVIEENINPQSRGTFSSHGIEPIPSLETGDLALVRDLSLLVRRTSTERQSGHRRSMDHADFLSFGLNCEDETTMDMDERVEVEPNENNEEGGYHDIKHLETVMENLDKISMENDPTTTPTTPPTP